MFDLRVDLSDSIKIENVESSSVIELIEVIVHKYLSYLFKPLGKTESKIKRDKELGQMISKYYGLSGRALNKEEIALLTGKTKERVRQQLKTFANSLSNIINDKDTEFKVKSQIQNKFSTFKNTIESIRILSKEKLNDILSNSFGINTAKSKEEYLNILFDTIGTRERTPIAHHLKSNTFIFTDATVSIEEFFEICYLVYISLEKNVVPTELDDIIIDVKRNNSKFPKELIELACKNILEIEQVKDENLIKYQLRFENLSSAKDMAYRILSQKGEFIKLAELIKNINHILYKAKSTKKVTSSIATQLANDSKFVSQGKTGYWGLTEWQGSNETLFDLVNNTLIHFNKPLSKKEIFSHIIKDRPKVPVRSLDTIMYDKTRYLKLKDGTFILNDWRDLYKTQVVKTERRNNYSKSNPIKEQIKDQAIQLMRQNGGDNLYLNSIVKTLHNKFGYPKASVYGIINTNDEFIKTEEGSKKIVSLNSNLKIENVTTKTTSVFISYCWENEQHQEKVISFVDFLRKRGFNADLDISIMQEQSATDFNRLMHKGIKSYDKVIVILSEQYKKKAESFEGGVGKEYRYIQNTIDKEPRKFVFASFISLTANIIEKITPLDFQGRELVDLKKDEKNSFQYLFSKLTDINQYNFSTVASNTPLVETKKIKPFTLTD